MHENKRCTNLNCSVFDCEETLKGATLQFVVALNILQVKLPTNHLFNNLKSKMETLGGKLDLI